MLKRKLGIGFLMALMLALVASQVSTGTIFFNSACLAKGAYQVVAVQIE